jgi:RNA polymerase sigma factor (sigma-70 family)
MIELSKAEELELWRIRKRSARARDLLTRRYLAWAFKWSGKFKGPRLHHNDAVSAANAGLMEAMSRYDPFEPGASHFTTFSALFIRRHLINALIDSYPVKLSDHVRKRLAMIKDDKEAQEVQRKLGEAATLEEAFEKLGAVPDFDVSSMHEKQEDAPSAPYEAPNPADETEISSLPAEVKKGIKTLKLIERRVILARYYTIPAESFDALGVRLGRTKVFLREVHDEALVKLRRYMQK